METKTKESNIFKRFISKKRNIVIVSILLVLTILVIYLWPFIRVVRNAYIVKDMFKNLDYEIKYEASEIIHGNEKADKVLKYFKSNVDKGVLRGGKFQSDICGEGYVDEKDVALLDFYYTEGDVYVNAKNVADYIEKKGGYQGAIIKALQLKNDSYVSLKKLGIISDDSSTAMKEDDKNEWLKEVIYNLRKTEKPSSSVYEEEIKDYDFFKTKLKSMKLIVGTPKEVQKDKVHCYIHLEKNGKTAEFIVDAKKSDKTSMEVPVIKKK